VLDLARLRDPAASGTTAAIAGIIETGTSGPVGMALTPDGAHLLVASAEAAGAEDGGVEVTAIALPAHRVAQRIRLRDAGGEPCRADSPDPGYGRFPNPNGIAVSPLGTGWLLTANGGTDDVSVIDLRRALAGDAAAEVARIPVQSGGFGIGVSPDGRLAAVASRESMRTGAFGNTVSLIDIAAQRETARIQVGTDDPAQGTRPFVAAFTPGGAHLGGVLLRLGHRLAGRGRVGARGEAPQSGRSLRRSGAAARRRHRARWALGRGDRRPEDRTGQQRAVDARPARSDRRGPCHRHRQRNLPSRHPAGRPLRPAGAAGSRQPVVSRLCAAAKARASAIASWSWL
jgi:hypothetical protein